MSPSVYIIAGPNGVGKTTFAQQFLSDYADCNNFINADLIAQSMSPSWPETVSFRAGRSMLHEINVNVSQHRDFGFETTLSGRSHLKLIRDLKRAGYGTHIFFLWVPTVDLSLSRVRGRVLRGGHDVPEIVVRRRFRRSIRNFLTNYRQLADSWTLFDNSAEAPVVIAFQKRGDLHIMEQATYDRIVGQFGTI
jgi:predicted ABC-type ATPase